MEAPSKLCSDPIFPYEHKLMGDSSEMTNPAINRSRGDILDPIIHPEGDRDGHRREAAFDARPSRPSRGAVTFAPPHYKTSRLSFRIWIFQLYCVKGPWKPLEGSLIFLAKHSRWVFERRQFPSRSRIWGAIFRAAWILTGVVAIGIATPVFRPQK